MLEAPKKNEDAGSVMGLKANDEVLISSKGLSLLLSGASEINVKLLLSPFDTNGNFPVVGDGCTCSATGFRNTIQYVVKIRFKKNAIQRHSQSEGKLI